jgi:hypothetical protein
MQKENLQKTKEYDSLTTYPLPATIPAIEVTAELSSLLQEDYTEPLCYIKHGCIEKTTWFA